MTILRWGLVGVHYQYNAIIILSYNSSNNNNFNRHMGIWTAGGAPFETLSISNDRIKVWSKISLKLTFKMSRSEPKVTFFPISKWQSALSHTLSHSMLVSNLFQSPTSKNNAKWLRSMVINDALLFYVHIMIQTLFGISLYACFTH